ncbi:ribosomal RNA small subunit methyltransferase A [Candidatus Saccharibacteria bacterium]|nr:ribosomal RNA small subunit methyltransferase A [Candidatus Saccharibacteria bacterium]
MRNIKSLGQNWLKNRVILDDIAELASSEKGTKLCVEIGPGLGTLTSSLLKRFDKVIAIEFDQTLAKNLPASFPGKNLEVINEDILAFDFAQINEPFVVAGNIPYYITTPIIKKLLSLDFKPERIVLLVQKEVAEKICDQTHSSSLSLFVQNLATPSLGPVVKREFFTPPPKVDSRVLVLTPLKSPRFSSELLSFIEKCFISPRKKLTFALKSLSSKNKEELELALTKISLSASARPADLTLEDYAMLANILKKS